MSMSDQFTEITNESWFSRIGSSIKGILTGIVLILVAFPILFLNEGRAVKRYKTLKEGGSNVVSVSTDTLNAENEGKLVHLSGMAQTQDTLTDPTFDVSINAIKLNRIVKMYQWEQKSEKKSEKKLGGGTTTTTTYTYNKVWSDSLIDSGSFKNKAGHENPSTMLYKSEEQLATDVSMGKYELSRDLVTKISGYSTLKIDPKEAKIPNEIKAKANFYNGGFYMGKSSQSPQIGDMQVTFQVIKPTEVSIVAKQAGKSLESYKTEVGGSILLLQMGTADAKTMFDQAQADNTKLTWLLRGLGFILMVVGFTVFFKPLSVLADVIPFIGNLIEGGVLLVALMFSAMLSSITIAIGWIVYRPILGIGLLVVAGISSYLIFGRIKAGKVKRQERLAELDMSMPA
ncbi:MAG TPA: hypothetical protein DER01_00775 [Phycisphaerales bacterium]|nr:hypothetical protein [Phycisphaerales bacterium]|tara:strand:- start:241 stop:1440 length:1200 start_codon:yes stop_codon:yes gene_type:complete